MLAVECIGYFKEENCQEYPVKVAYKCYPRKGNFLAFVGNAASLNLLKNSIGYFRESCNFPSEGIAAPEAIPGIDWSDQMYFWQCGYPGLMITDTALYRNPHYHTPQDSAATLNYGHMARVVDGLTGLAKHLATTSAYSRS